MNNKLACKTSLSCRLYSIRSILTEWPWTRWGWSFGWRFTSHRLKFHWREANIRTIFSGATIPVHIWTSTNECCCEKVGKFLYGSVCERVPWNNCFTMSPSHTSNTFRFTPRMVHYQRVSNYQGELSWRGTKGIVTLIANHKSQMTHTLVRTRRTYWNNT